jgi:putative lipoprotein
MRLRGAAAILLVLALEACAGPKPPSPAPAPPAAPAPPPTAAPAPALTPAPPPEPVVPPPTAFLTGTVVYELRIALTPQAEVQVELRDVSLEDTASVLIAKQVISTPGQAPIPFALEYDPTRIQGGRVYAISARITDRGQLQFVTDTRIPVLTGGAQGPVEILVVPIR